jgi:putative transposase
MKHSRYPHEQIVRALRQAEAGAPVVELCREFGVAEATFYRGKKQFGDLGGS